MGPKIHQKSIKNGVGNTTGNNTGKMWSTIHPGGMVRRSRDGHRKGGEGKPSGYGRIPKVPSGLRTGSIYTPSTPVGYGEFKPLREIAVPQGNPGERAPESHGVSRSSRQNPALAVPGESCGRKSTKNQPKTTPERPKNNII